METDNRFDFQKLKYAVIALCICRQMCYQTNEETRNVTNSVLKRKQEIYFSKIRSLL